MSAQAFEALQNELNPAGTAFTERLAAARAEMAQLQAVERELKQDDAKFQSDLQTLRQSLESTSRSLTAATSRRARLAKELAVCDEEVGKLEALKAETSQQIHEATAGAASNREKKLAALQGGAAKPAAPKPAAAPPPDLLGGDLLGGGGRAPPVPDLLGSMQDLVSPSAPASGQSALDLLAGAGFDAPLAPPRPPAPPQPAPLAPALASVADGFEDSFAGFDVDVSDVAAVTPANPFSQPPAAMMPMGGGGGNPFGAAPPPAAAGGLGALPPLSFGSAGGPAAASQRSPAADPFDGLMGLGR